MESILTSIKKLLGIAEDYEYFDTDIIMHINSAFMVLNQLGVGPSKPFFVEDKTKTWSDFLAFDMEAVKTYIYFKVKLAFDPPTSSAVIESINKQINELEWRLNVAAESKVGE